MTIKEASQRTGLSVDNLRYYERIGLIPPIPKNPSGIREYDERAIHWIEFVLKFKRAGAALETIIEYIRLANSTGDSKEARRALLLEVEEELKGRIRGLEGCLELIQYKIENFDDLCDPITQSMVEEWKEGTEDRL